MTPLTDLGPSSYRNGTFIVLISLYVLGIIWFVNKQQVGQFNLSTLQMIPVHERNFNSFSLVSKQVSLFFGEISIKSHVQRLKPRPTSFHPSHHCTIVRLRHFKAKKRQTTRHFTKKVLEAYKLRRISNASTFS